jgi:hypothetical protein
MEVIRQFFPCIALPLWRMMEVNVLSLFVEQPMTPYPLADPDAIPQSRKRRKRLLIASLFLLPVCLIGAGAVYLHFRGESALQEAIAEADRLEPDGWRIADIQAHRAVVPDAENSGLQVIAARKLLPMPWPRFPTPVNEEEEDPNYASEYRSALENGLFDAEPPVQLHDKQVAALRAEMKRAEAALRAARKLRTMPRGRYPLTITKDFISTLLPDAQGTREIANLLGYDVMLRAHDRDIDGALESGLAGINAARALGDEPFLISQLVRIACHTIAMRKIERALAQGEASEASLRVLQKVLEEEAEEPLLLYGLRGERGGVDGLMQCIQDGEIKFSQLRGLMSFGMPGVRLDPFEDLGLIFMLVSPKTQRAALLKYETGMVEIAKLPAEQQLPKLKEHVATLHSQPVMVRLLAPALEKVASACHRTQAETRCAAVALAVERYRLARGHWPDSLAILIPDFLPKVPTDPFDGLPLRFRPFDQGVVIYSVGPDGVDNGGNIGKNPVAPGSDLGFRLWDLKHRRQPPQPLELPEPPPKAPPPDADPEGKG